MAILLIGLSVMAIMMSVAMPVWSQMARREKEAELVFRGEQYARAIGLFQRRRGPGVLPANLDVLVEERYLRKRYKDPITGEDFLPLTQTQSSAGPISAPTQQGGAGGPGVARGSTPPAGGRGAPASGVIGVVSGSDERSLMLYNGRNYYNAWQFVYVQQTQAHGAVAEADSRPAPAPDQQAVAGADSRPVLPAPAPGLQAAAWAEDPYETEK